MTGRFLNRGQVGGTKSHSNIGTIGQLTDVRITASFKKRSQKTKMHLALAVVNYCLSTRDTQKSMHFIPKAVASVTKRGNLERIYMKYHYQQTPFFYSPSIGQHKVQQPQLQF